MFYILVPTQSSYVEFYTQCNSTKRWMRLGHEGSTQANGTSVFTNKAGGNNFVPSVTGRHRERDFNRDWNDGNWNLDFQCPQLLDFPFRCLCYRSPTGWRQDCFEFWPTPAWESPAHFSAAVQRRNTDHGSTVFVLLSWDPTSLMKIK